MHLVDVRDHYKSLRLYMYHRWHDVGLRMSVEEGRKTESVLLVAKRARYTLIIFTVTAVLCDSRLWVNRMDLSKWL